MHQGHDHHASPASTTIKNTLSAVVQIVALKRGFLGNASTVWTGSGTIIDPRGYILTNCHVANPRAMGMPSPDADALGVAITTRSDEAPALTYLAEIVAQSPELDLAVLRITRQLNGSGIGTLNLTSIPVGDSDQVELGDSVAIFGYPGIGGQTVTFTSGTVAGFSASNELRVRRAWIKTDATIAGGNSGGTAINSDGQLIGVPTQAAAGDNITPVDARPVIDTNRDGRIDERDSIMAIGGFINGLRPVNLAKPLLRKAGIAIDTPKEEAAVKIETPAPAAPQNIPAPTPSPTGVQFSSLVFSGAISKEGRPINPSEILPTGTASLFVSFQYQGMKKGTLLRQVWAHNGVTIMDRSDPWTLAETGGQTLTLSNRQGMPDGEYRLVLSVADKIVGEGAVTIGRKIEDNDTELSGIVVDAQNKRPISDALVIVLKPNVRVMDFVKVKNRNMAFTSARTNQSGAFTFPQQLPKGQAYSLVVVARGYKDLAVEGAIQIHPTAPEHATMNPIPLQPE